MLRGLGEAGTATGAQAPCPGPLGRGRRQGGAGQGPQESTGTGCGSKAVALCPAHSKPWHLLAAVLGELGLKGAVSLREAGNGGEKGWSELAWLGDDALGGPIPLRDTHKTAEPESPLQDPVTVRLPCEGERA